MGYMDVKGEKSVKEKQISVIVPCYNAAEFIPRCMEYLLKQTIGLDNMEIILVDDASTDNGATLEVLYSYEKQCPDSIIVIASSENRRQGGARNLGLQYASGEYIAYCDADDWYCVDAMKKLYTIAKEYDCDAVEFNNQNMMLLDEPLEPVRKACEEDKIWVIEADEDRKKYLLEEELGTGCWGRIYRTAMLKENDIRFVEGVAWEEPSFTYITRFYVKKHYYLKEILHYTYLHDGSTTRSSYEAKKYDNMVTYSVLIEDIIRRGFLERYRQEIEYIFWHGYFFSSLCFTAAYAQTFYPKSIFIEMQENTQKIVPDIKSNSYFLEVFSGFPEIADLTYCDMTDVDMQTVYEIFRNVMKLYFKQ